MERGHRIWNRIVRRIKSQLQLVILDSRFELRKFRFGPSKNSTFFDPGSGWKEQRSQNADERRQAIEGLISRWVSQRLEMMRLTDAERVAVTREMEQGRKQGMGGLKNAQQAGQASQSRTNCPICDGSFGACKLSAR